MVRWLIGIGGLALSACSPAETAVVPEPPLVQTVEAAPGAAAVARFTGVVRARTESNLGFRVGGKIFERLVDPGDHVRLGQPLMRLDRTDFTLALNAARASVEAARAQMIKAKADEERSRKLVGGWTSKPRSRPTTRTRRPRTPPLPSSPTPRRRRARSPTKRLFRTPADADGVVMEVPSEPGQVSPPARPS